MADYQRLRSPFSKMFQDHLHELFAYDDGVLRWKIDRAKGKIKAGSVAGCKTSKGYWRVMIDYKEYPLHKIVFFMHHGFCPEIVDHINGNPLDNRIENLRSSTSQTNQYNRKVGKNNTSGCKNVSWHSKKNMWQVHIKKQKKTKCWYVEDFEFAELLAHEARNLYHGSFANHG